MNGGVDLWAGLPQIRYYEFREGVGIGLGAWIEAQMGVCPSDVRFRRTQAKQFIIRNRPVFTLKPR